MHLTHENLAIILHDINLNKRTNVWLIIFIWFWIGRCWNWSKMVFGHALDLPRSNGAKTWTKLLKILSRQSLSGNSDMSETHKKHIPTGHFLSMSSEFGNLHEKKTKSLVTFWLKNFVSKNFVRIFHYVQNVYKTHFCETHSGSCLPNSETFMIKNIYWDNFTQHGISGWGHMLKYVLWY